MANNSFRSWFAHDYSWWKISCLQFVGNSCFGFCLVLSFVCIFACCNLLSMNYKLKATKASARTFNHKFIYFAHKLQHERERKAYMLRIPTIASCVSTNLEHGTHSHWFHQTNKTASFSASLSKREMIKKEGKWFRTLID